MIFNLGSINIDHFYTMPHLPAPGETLAARDYRMGLGGKGANQSVAAARAGARVVHIGAVGPEAGWAVERLAGFGVETDHIARLETPTGHAIINVDAGGENSIVLFPGANQALDMARVTAALAGAAPGDLLLMQNETNLQAETARLARDRGITVMYSAAPFDADAVLAVLPYVSILALNAVEAGQLCDALSLSLDEIAVAELVVTRGAEGAEWRSRDGQQVRVPGQKVAVLDTTGAGDTFAGYFAAARDAGQSPAEALEIAGAAASLKVTRRGTADAIPDAAEVGAFRAARSGPDRA